MIFYVYSDRNLCFVLVSIIIIIIININIITTIVIIIIVIICASNGYRCCTKFSEILSAVCVCVLRRGEGDGGA